MATIDGVNHNFKGVLTPGKGSGDSEETFELKILQAEEGPERWLLTDQGKWWLFQAPSGPIAPFTIAKEHERFEAQRFAGNYPAPSGRLFRWVQLEQPYLEIEPPFQGTTEAMLISGEDFSQIFLSLPLMVGAPDVYYTPSFPASEIPRDAVSVRPGLGGGKLVPHFSLLLALLFGGAGFAGWVAPIKALWWLGPLAIFGRFGTTRQSLADHALRLLAGVFFLDFISHGLDNNVTAEWDEPLAPLFESAKVGGICALLWLLRLWQPRLFFSAIDGVNFAGGCSWLVFACGMAIVTMVEEFNYFRFFDWYAGELPWTALWLIAGVLGIWHKFKDYRNVPLDLRGFRSLLYRTTDTLDQKLDVCVHKSQVLSEWADDLEDALVISADPLVASLADYGPSFLAWRDQAKNLQDVSPSQLDPETRQSLEADLATIASDFRDLIACLDGAPGSLRELRSLRRSPLLETWNQ